MAIHTGSAPAATCPNEALRVAQNATDLPGCMALEMVSPGRKFSQRAHLPSFSRNGERAQIKVDAALAETPGYQLGFGGDTYVASRGPSGWSLAATAPPDVSILAGGPRFANPATFTTGLERWTQLGSTQAQYQVGVTRLFAGGLDGSFEPLSPLLEPIDDSGQDTLVAIVNAMEVHGSSAGLEVTVLRPRPASTAYFPADPRGNGEEAGRDRNSYLVSLDESGEPTLQLLARDKGGVVWGGRCGAHLGGEGAAFNQGAISADGKRIYLSTRPAQPFDSEKAEGPACDTVNPLRVLRRDTTASGPQMTEIAAACGGPTAPGDDLFQGASADATKVYFTSPRKVTASDKDPSAEQCGAELGKSKGCDLYLYDATKPAAQRLRQVSAGVDPTPGQGADVLSGATAISGDGSRAYFLAQGALTGDPNPEGDTAQAGEPNLYLYEATTDTISFLAIVSGEDQGGLWGTKGTLFGDAYAVPLYGPEGQGGGDGHLLAFASKAPLTADDADAGHRDVFRYDALADTLQRISKAPAGGSDDGPFEVVVNPAPFEEVEYNFGEATRWVSEDGQTIAFASAEALLPGDEDNLPNPYLWHAGRLGAVFAELTTVGGAPKAPAVAPVGGQAIFSTATELLPGDGEGAEDVYVAREGGGFPLPVAPTICDPRQEGSCRTAPAPPQAPPAPASSSFSGPGNARQPARCRRSQVKRKGRCVKRRSAKRKAAKRAGRRRGGKR